MSLPIFRPEWTEIAFEVKDPVDPGLGCLQDSGEYFSIHSICSFVHNFRPRGAGIKWVSVLFVAAQVL